MKRATFLLGALAATAAAVLVVSTASAQGPFGRAPGIHSLPSVYLSIADVTANEGQTATMTITSSMAVPYPITVYWETRNGTALAPRDYKYQWGEAMIPASKTTTTCKVASFLNGIHTGTVSFKVRLYWSDSYVGFSRPEATYTILDLDPVPTVHISEAPKVVEGGTLDYTVTLTNKTVDAVTVDLGLWYSAAYRGSILHDGDYVGVLPASVHFDPLVTTQHYTIQTKPDALNDSTANPILAWMHLTGVTSGAVLPFTPDPAGVTDYTTLNDPNDNWGLGLVSAKP